MGAACVRVCVRGCGWWLYAGAAVQGFWTMSRAGVRAVLRSALLSQHRYHHHHHHHHHDDDDTMLADGPH
jgi:hypothetical protein